MSITNITDRNLTIVTHQLTRGRAARRVAASWIGQPELDGWHPADVLRVLTRRDHACHNQLIAGLIRRSQNRDADATVLLLGALQTGLWRLAHTYHRRDLAHAFDELIFNTLLVIERVDPTQDQLYDRILGRIRAATPRCPEELPEDPVDELEDRPEGSEDATIAQIEARDTLRRLATLSRNGEIPADRWHDLVAVRLAGRPTHEVARGRTDDHVRADLSRFSQQLERRIAA